MRTHLAACFAPLLLRFDFARWPNSRPRADGWLAAAWLIDMLRLWLMDLMTPFGAIGGLIWALLMRQLPVRLSAAAGAFAIGQAAIAYGLYVICILTLPDVQAFSLGNVLEVWVPELPGYAWLVWSVVAFCVMVLHYIRWVKPKA